VRILTNPGSNLVAAALRHYEIELSPQHIVVDGTLHDTRAGIPHERIDEWIRTAKEYPYVVGSSAQELVSILNDLVQKDPSVLVLMTSKKIIQSHAAAVTAVRTLEARSTWQGKVAVIDSKLTDGATGLMAIAAGEARKAAIGLARTTRLMQVMAERGRLVATVASLDNLVKGGRASWLRAQVATFLRRKPLIGFLDGESANLGTYPSNADRCQVMVQHMVEEFGRGRPVWASVFHGGVPLMASVLATEVRKVFDVKYLYSQPLSSSIYLHVGAEGLGLAVFPMDELPWSPPVPPDFT
jgi:DegV family protein with EDD domain